MPIPPDIHGQKYICLITFRRTGDVVSTPVWFAEKDDKLYVKTRRDSGKAKRIRNNPRVRVASCTISGKVTGPEFEAYARISTNWFLEARFRDRPLQVEDGN